MNLQESGEMYLETILVLSKELSRVRSIDISDHMGYSKPSVSRAVGLLKNGGYITVDNDGYLYLTPVGKEVAESIYERHNVISQFFVSIGVDKEVATEDACRIEHVISQESFEKLKEHMGLKQ